MMNTKLANLCPVEGCNILGGSLFRKAIKKNKNGHPLKYYYFEHRVSGSKSVSHYVGKTKPRIQKVRVEMKVILE